MNRSRATTMGIVFSVLVSLTACQPRFMSHAEVEVTGEFREDGSCAVSAAGRPLFRAEEHARTVYVGSVGIFQCDLDGVQAGGRMFMMHLASTGKIPPQPGTFTIGSTATPGEALTIGGAYFDPRHYGFFKSGGGIGIMGKEFLQLTSGAIEFTRLDSIAVSRPFHLKAVRVWVKPQ
jgi:hypothetical protein